MSAASWDLIRRIASVEGRVARLALWAETIQSRSAAQAAIALGAAVLGASARDPVATVAYMPLLDLPGLAAHVGPGRLATVLMAAREENVDGCLLLLEHPGPSRASPHIGPPPDPAIEALSLGHRRALARGRRGPILERILKDPDPRVVIEILRNPGLREFEVLTIASRRPCPEPVFWSLARADTWIRRPAVRRAMALNPYCPPQLAVALVVLLPDPELRDIEKAAGLHPAIWSGALEVLTWRKDARSGR